MMEFVSFIPTETLQEPKYIVCDNSSENFGIMADLPWPKKHGVSQSGLAGRQARTGHTVRPDGGGGPARLACGIVIY